MKTVCAIIAALIGVALIWCGIGPLRLSLKLGYVLIIMGALCLLGIPLSFVIKQRLPQLFGALRLIIPALFAVGAVLLLITGFQIASRNSPEDAPQNSVILVLGCGLSQKDNLTPSLTLAQRLDVGAALLNERPGAVCIVSGGQGPGELVSEAQAMKTYLVERHGIDPARIFMEDESADTEANLVLSARLMRENGLGDGAGSVALVTSGFHAYRSCFFAQKAGLVPYSQPSEVLASILPMYWLRESLAVVFEVWLGF